MCFGKEWKRKESFLILKRFTAIRTRNVLVAMLVLDVFFKVSLFKKLFPLILHVSFGCFNVLQHFFPMILELTGKKRTTVFANRIFLFMSAVMSSKMICIFQSLITFGT